MEHGQEDNRPWRIVVKQTGGPEVLARQQFNIPLLVAGQYLINVSYIPVTIDDVHARRVEGIVPVPFLPGSMGIGHIVAVGPGTAEGFEEGEKVVFFTGANRGAYAELVVVGPQARMVRLLNDDVEDDLVAAILMPGMMAGILVWNNRIFKVKRKHYVLVHRADGERFMPLLLVRMAKIKEARVIATVRGAANAQRARPFCDRVIDLNEYEDFEVRVKEFKPKDVDVVYCNSAGVESVEQCADCLKKSGHLITYGDNAQCNISLNKIFENSITFRHFNLDLVSESVSNPDFAEIMMELLTEGRNWIITMFRQNDVMERPLLDAPQAHKDFEENRATFVVLNAHAELEPAPN